MAIARQGLGIDRLEYGVVPGKNALEAPLVALDLDVPDVADLFDRGEGLAGNAVP